MSTSNKKKTNKTKAERLEEMFAKYGIKVVWVHKTGCSAIISNRPIPKKSKNL